MGTLTLGLAKGPGDDTDTDYKQCHTCSSAGGYCNHPLLQGGHRCCPQAIGEKSTCHASQERVTMWLQRGKVQESRACAVRRDDEDVVVSIWQARLCRPGILTVWWRRWWWRGSLVVHEGLSIDVTSSGGQSSDEKALTLALENGQRAERGLRVWYQRALVIVYVQYEQHTLVYTATMVSSSVRRHLRLGALPSCLEVHKLGSQILLFSILLDVGQLSIRN